MDCSFNRQHYAEILETALEHGYRFIPYESLSTVAPGQRVCILRHDIDYMPEWAVPMAEMEADLGISATYFFQVCAKTYNLRES